MASYHRCANCGHETQGVNALTAFEDNPFCRQCGLSLRESDTKMQDDLVNLMTQHLQLSPSQHQHDASMPPTPQVAPIQYITQHYHHSSHQVPVESSISAILESAGVNASVLLPSQLSLFRNAEPEQRKRLVELWTIAPPTYGKQLPSSSMGNWPQTSMEHEEEAARMRWQFLEQEKERLKNLSIIPNQEMRGQAEPYIVNGYTNLPNINGNTAPQEYGSAPRQAVDQKSHNDPAYNSKEWWNLNGNVPMEHQYGMLQHMLYHNEVGYGGATGDDEEML